jgi:hypothetical protein
MILDALANMFKWHHEKFPDSQILVPRLAAQLHPSVCVDRQVL